MLKLLFWLSCFLCIPISAASKSKQCNYAQIENVTTAMLGRRIAEKILAHPKLFNTLRQTETGWRGFLYGVAEEDSWRELKQSYLDNLPQRFESFFEKKRAKGSLKAIDRALDNMISEYDRVTSDLPSSMLTPDNPLHQVIVKDLSKEYGSIVPGAVGDSDEMQYDILPGLYNKYRRLEKPWDAAKAAYFELQKNKPRKGSTAALAQKIGIGYLFHTTTIDNAVGIAEKGRIFPASKTENPQNRSWDTFDYVFMEVGGLFHAGKPIYTHGSTNVQKTIEPYKKVVFIFDTDALNRDDYIITPAWNYGKRSQGTVSAKNTQKLGKMFLDIATGSGVVNDAAQPKPNELVFSKGKDLKLSEGLRSILVHPDNRKTLLKKLENIPPPKGRTWEEIVIATEVYP